MLGILFWAGLGFYFGCRFATKAAIANNAKFTVLKNYFS